MSTPQHASIIEFICTFATVSTPPETIKDLSDGVALFEALSEIAPDYFDPTTIARHLGDNWALKSSNLRKLIRNLEQFYHFGLNKDADFSAINMQDIARESDEVSISSLVELVAAAAVTCPEKSVYVGRIMEMSPDGQAELKVVLQTGMRRLSDYEADYDQGDENELVFDNEDYENDDDNNDEEEDAHLFGANHLKYQNAENMEEELLDARNELVAIKSQAAVANEESEKIQSKLRALVDDLQDRLSRRQDELSQLETDLTKANRELDETKVKLADVEAKKVQMADDLEIAQAKAQNLNKAEAKVAAYQKKLESVGVINQQMNELEGQAASYLQQIMDLEAEVKKSAALQKTVSELEEKIMRLEKERSDTEASNNLTSSEITDLKNRLNLAEKQKKLYEDELMELRSKQDVMNAADEDVTTGVAGLSLVENQQPSAEHREKLMRAEIENKQLREQVENLTKEVAAASVAAKSVQLVESMTPQTSPETSTSTDDATRELKQEIQRLHDALALKEKENAKISSDKDKLEAYTKRTLAKFQDKYLVALQECKAKLKEKQDKIDALESRSASERTAQKREERLLSSTIYELGLAIMQHRLKTSTAGGGSST